MTKRILFVDDEVHWRLMVSMFLKLNGYEVVTAKDGTEAMRQSERAHLDAIVLDVNLAGEDCAVLMKSLKAKQPNVPVFLYTGHEHNDEAVEKLFKAGANRYLRKGNLQDLLSRIQGIATRGERTGAAEIRPGVGATPVPAWS